jgi:hypothetical protein
MQDLGYEFPRTLLVGSLVNRDNQALALLNPLVEWS